MAGMSSPRRGDIYWVQLDPVVGSEIAKTRPALIISNNVGNEHAARVIVAPITTGGLVKVYPFEVRINAGEGGLDRDGKVLLDQIRTVDKVRLGRRIGALEAARMREVDRAIQHSLGM
jgi:mRNA interferase MazF